jgi:hypothetical protein
MLQEVTEIQAADLFNGVAAMIPQELDQVAAKRGVVEQKRAEINRTLMLDDQRTAVGRAGGR